jgi:antitoxin component of MazEF toxin-antitoxin module
MQLQKQLSRAVAGKEYAKYVLVIPPSSIEQLRWKEGEELEHEVKDETLLIRKASYRTEDDALKLIEKHRKNKKR